MIRLFTLAWCLALGACAGPEASDAALCRDTVHRLCLAPRCAEVDAALGVGEDCEVTLLQRTGCAGEDFTFSSPTRERWLSCRLPLVRGGAGVQTHPACLDVSDLLACPDVVAFFRGAAP